MTEPTCESCGVLVSPRERVCTHGHSIGDPASTGSLTVLRSQVDDAFEEARLKIDRMTAPVPPTGARVGVAPPPPPPPLFRPVAPKPDAVRAVAGESVAGEPVPPPRSPAQGRNTFASLENTPAVPSDPIQAFAPAPVMDWGPSKWGRFRRAAY